MANRTTETIVTFSSPFLLPGFDAPQPAGDYRVDQDEESIDGAAWVGWRRIACFLHTPAVGARGLRRENDAGQPRRSRRRTRKGSEPMTISTTKPLHFRRAPTLPVATHQFQLGQVVRLTGGLWPSGNVYVITALLPPVGDVLQYRIRNEAEKFDRMAAQNHLELADAGADSSKLVEQSYRVARKA